MNDCLTIAGSFLSPLDTKQSSFFAVPSDDSTTQDRLVANHSNDNILTEQITYTIL
jgi:hypothetical protein